jgi:excinuclease UvrABC ATPase subunit
MELSSLFTKYNVPLSKAERALFSDLKSGGTSRSDEYYEQQIKRLAETREALKQLPDKKRSDRQSRSEKAKMLKERLKMLKQMIPFMSASAAKSLKSELKQIAAQIASLSDSNGSGGLSSGSGPEAAATSSATVNATTDSATQAEAATAEVATEAAVESSDTEQQSEKDGEPAEAKDKDATATENSALEQANQSKSESAADRAEKEELEKLKQLYQAVKNMLERKLQKPDDPATQAALQMQAYQAAAEVIRESGVSIKG